MSVLSSRIRECRERKGLKQSDLEKILGVKNGVVSNWERDINRPDVDKLMQLCDALDTTPSYLLNHPSESVYIRPHGQQPVPMLGGVAALGAEIKCDFCLYAKGESMLPTIHDGDIVFVRKQPTVETGEIAAVMIDDEVTLRRFYRSGHTVMLVSDNPAYPPLVYANITDVRILGLAVAIERDISIPPPI